MNATEIETIGLAYDHFQWVSPFLISSRRNDVKSHELGKRKNRGDELMRCSAQQLKLMHVVHWNTSTTHSFYLEPFYKDIEAEIAKKKKERTLLNCNS